MLEQIGVPFQQLAPPAIDESRRPDELARDYVARLAREKAQSGQRTGLVPNAPVLGADTTVVLAGECLGKPANTEEAAATLRRLSGTWHQVLSGVCVRVGDDDRLCVVASDVAFIARDEGLIARYLATGEPMDKAGAYGIQGRGAVFVDQLRGSFSNVVGLPLAQTRPLLDWAGVGYWQQPE